MPLDVVRCATCGASLTPTPVVASIPPDAPTGLPPPGANDGVRGFPPSSLSTTGATGAPTGGPAATTGDEASGLATGSVRPMAGPLRIGQAFGNRYRITRLLGMGGMGAVYQAWDSELGVTVALKVIRADRHDEESSDLERQFKNELLLARQVTHKHVVRIHDLGEIDGIKYITMPYVEGKNLSKVLRQDRKFPLGRALRLARQVAHGLEAAHEAGVVHRDLKPANIMISGTGDDEQALIMDFGISASASDAETGDIVGTLEYMAPEQGEGRAVDGRADIYAFGLILYEMLIGPRRGTATTPQDRITEMKRRFEQGVPSLRTVDASIPDPLDALIRRCLERDPAARFATSTELVAALAALDDAGELIPIHARVSKRMMAAAAVIVLMLLGGMYVVGRRLAPQPPVAHEPVSVLIADFQNGTGDPTFDSMLEPMLKLELEGAGFISAFDRSGIARGLGVRPPETLNEQSALELAVKQGVGVVLSGSLDRQGNGYGVSVKATQAVTGTVITTARNRAASKEQVLRVATTLATRVREALGDDTSDAAQRFAMETLSATSLDVVRDYAVAMEALSNGSFEEALGSFSKAVDRDPQFGLAYAGMAVASANLGQRQEAEQYIKEAISHLDGMTERERYRTRGLFYGLTGDSQQCVKEYGDLVARYAADVSARNNLALCLTFLRNMPRAVDEMRQVVKILPKRALYRVNLALYADYSGDFQTAEQEVRALEEPGLSGLLALAFAQMGQGQLPQATETFQAIGKIDVLGASHAASGLADLALYEGRLSDAVRLLERGAAVDLTAKNPDRAAAKFASLAYAHVVRGQKGPAVAAAQRALANSQTVKIRFLAARIFIEAGDIAKARPLIAGLASELQAEPQAYAKILEGGIALRSKDVGQAIKVLIEANGLLDTWIGHFDLGRAYLEAGPSQLVQADSEFDRAIKRRGEVLSLFLDQEPTYGYFPPVYYYQGRVREGLKNARFAESYRVYLTIRGQSTEDPLLPEVRRRAGQ